MSDCFFISEEWVIEHQTLYHIHHDPHDGEELYEEYPITWIYYCPYQIIIETDSGILFLSRLANNYVGLTCRSSNNEYTYPVRMKWRKLIKFLMNH